MTVLNVRGISGSGKTTLAREVLEHSVQTVMTPAYVNKFGSKRPNGWPVHLCDTPAGRVNVYGRYETKCGGCDTETDMDAVQRNVQWGLDNLEGHHFFEGMVVSNSGKRFRDMALANSPERWCFLFLVPGIDECERRVMIRNGGKPIKRENLVNTQGSNDSTYRLFNSHSLRTVAVPSLARGEIWEYFL